MISEQKVAFFIDDDSDFLTILSSSLQHAQFAIKVHQAVNGYRTIDEIIKTKPDVLFLDFDLPKANAAQILPILRSIHGFANLPVYLVTGYSHDRIASILEDLDYVEYDGIIYKDGSLRQNILRILDQEAPAVSAN